MKDPFDTRAATFYHDGCATCLQIASTLARLTPALEVVDLSQQGERIAEAELLGVSALPCLVAEGELLPVSQHSVLAELGVH
ncbi:hypothetical protein [Massilia sp. ST3]|uniref:hypothetical protein n=1 Tax=Massilia sp. ST3 TaxID=2824903 RepID=UPI001B8415E6|nr:hypothetical protein [Massilia sp. ST3]MBQ5947908.1 hypothetical protein [Massilia sp. ST3]